MLSATSSRFLACPWKLQRPHLSPWNCNLKPCAYLSSCFKQSISTRPSVSPQKHFCLADPIHQDPFFRHEFIDQLPVIHTHVHNNIHQTQFIKNGNVGEIISPLLTRRRCWGEGALARASAKGSQCCESMPPLGSAILTPLSETLLCEAVIMRPMMEPVLSDLRAARIPTL